MLAAMVELVIFGEAGERAFDFPLETGKLYPFLDGRKNSVRGERFHGD